MMSHLKKLVKWITTPTITATGPPRSVGLAPRHVWPPLTEGKTLHGSKPGTARAPATPPPPGKPNKIKSGRCAPAYAIKSDWIEVYLGRKTDDTVVAAIEHHDNVLFWVDPNGNLVIHKSLLDNSVVYHDYIKYVTHNAKNWF